MDHELGVHPDLSLSVRVLKIWIVGVASVERPVTPHDPVRDQFDIAPRRNSLQSIERRCLAQPARHFVRNLRPKCVLVLPNDSAIQKNAPLLLFRRRKTQALEWNSHPHHKATAGHFAPRIPNRVPRDIPIAARFLVCSLGIDCIPLNAQRAGLKLIRAAPIVKGIEHDGDFVIVIDVLTTRHSRPHLLRIVEAHKHDVQVFLVVPEISGRLLRDLFPVVGIALHKTRDLRHLQRNVAPWLHPQEIFQGGRVRQPRNSQSRGHVRRLRRRLHVRIPYCRFRQLGRWRGILR